jgi:xanthomonalisin
MASTTWRNSPDVAAEANFDNPTVVNGSFVTGYGGTSFATPRWAGFLALVNQQSIANGKGTVGFINPTLYNVGRSLSYSTTFHDITSGSNPPTSGTGVGFSAVPGYDLVTGWGSPAGASLIGLLAGSGAKTANKTTR